MANEKNGAAVADPVEGTVLTEAEATAEQAASAALDPFTQLHLWPDYENKRVGSVGLRVTGTIYLADTVADQNLAEKLRNMDSVKVSFFLTPNVHTHRRKEKGSPLTLIIGATVSGVDATSAQDAND